MGRMQAESYASLFDRRQGLAAHLQSNHYPPIPLNMVTPCEQAIDLVNSGEGDVMVQLPETVFYKDRNEAPAQAIVEQHHLYPWVDEWGEE